MDAAVFFFFFFFFFGGGAYGVEKNVLVRLPQKRLQAQQDALDIVDRGPLLLFVFPSAPPHPTHTHTHKVRLHSPTNLEDIQTDPPGHIHVRMEHRRREQDGRCDHGVVGRKLQAQLEREPLVWRVLGPVDRCRPVEEVVAVARERADSGGGGHHQLHQFRLQAG